MLYVNYISIKKKPTNIEGIGSQDTKDHFIIFFVVSEYHLMWFSSVKNRVNSPQISQPSQNPRTYSF